MLCHTESENHGAVSDGTTSSRSNLDLSVFALFVPSFSKSLQPMERVDVIDVESTNQSRLM